MPSQPLFSEKLLRCVVTAAFSSFKSVFFQDSGQSDKQKKIAEKKVGIVRKFCLKNIS